MAELPEGWLRDVISHAQKEVATWPEWKRSPNLRTRQMTNEITDGMVQDACLASMAAPVGEHMRAALEAVAPRLRALGMREALEEIPESYVTFRERIEARAAELEK